MYFANYVGSLRRALFGCDTGRELAALGKTAAYDKVSNATGIVRLTARHSGSFGANQIGSILIVEHRRGVAVQEQDTCDHGITLLQHQIGDVLDGLLNAARQSPVSQYHRIGCSPRTAWRREVHHESGIAHLGVIACPRRATYLQPDRGTWRAAKNVVDDLRDRVGRYIHSKRREGDSIRAIRIARVGQALQGDDLLHAGDPFVERVAQGEAQINIRPQRRERLLYLRADLND